MKEPRVKGRLAAFGNLAFLTAEYMAACEVGLFLAYSMNLFDT